MANPAWPAPTITVSVHCIVIILGSCGGADDDAPDCGSALLIRGFDLDGDGRSVRENVEDSGTRASLLNDLPQLLGRCVSGDIERDFDALVAVAYLVRQAEYSL